MALPKVPLTKEEELAICKKCGGFCCKYYFINAEKNVNGLELHKFRKRKLIKCGVVSSIIMEDRCPYSNDETHFCDKYNDPALPKLCSDFPNKYRPFWNLRCKLMRVRYARRLIPKDITAFSKLKRACKPNKRVFKFF